MFHLFETDSFCWCSIILFMICDSSGDGSYDRVYLLNECSMRLSAGAVEVAGSV